MCSNGIGTRSGISAQKVLTQQDQRGPSDGHPDYQSTQERQPQRSPEKDALRVISNHHERKPSPHSVSTKKQPIVRERESAQKGR